MEQSTVIKLEIDNQMVLDSLKDSINKMVAEKVGEQLKQAVEEKSKNLSKAPPEFKELTGAMLFDITRYAIANFCENPAEVVEKASKMVLAKEPNFKNNPMIFLMFAQLSENLQKEVSNPKLIQKHA